MPFQIIRNDITKVKADAVVNTANPKVTVGSGVDSAIYNAAGREKLLAERQKIGYLAPGEVVVTPAFDLNAKYIIHASGPRWEGGAKGEADILRACYDNALQLAVDYNCKSIAFPLLATGSYGFPQRLGMEIAVDSFTGFLEEYDIEIFLVVFGKKSVKVSGELGEEVAGFIDDEYVSKALSKEYGHYTATDNRIKPCRIGLICDEETGPEEDLEDVLKGIYKESFEKHLQRIINKKGLKNSEVYATANVSKQYFSKLLKGQVKPSKEKVLALAVGLRLNIDEAVDFLKLAGYALSPISQTDAVVKYFIEHEEYSVLKIDIVLFDYGLDSLSND